MNPKRKPGLAHLTYALADQGAVSAGNFLVIALGAHFLPLPEQGKLIYAFGIYYGLVLLNIAALFTVPLLIRGESGDWACYRQMLFDFQAGFAVLSAALLGCAILLFGGLLDWTLSAPQAGLIAGFYFLQQLADFFRRSAYLFDEIALASISSQFTFWARILALILFHPNTLTGFLLILTLTAAIGASAAIVQRFVQPGPKCAAEKQVERIKRHFALSRWSLLNAPLTWGGLHLPILLAGALAGKEAAAILGSVRGLTAFVNILLEMLETFVPAWLSTHPTREGRLPLSPSLRLLAVGCIIWTIGLIAFLALDKVLIAVTLGKHYLPFHSMLIVIWLANGLYFVGRVIGLHFRMAMDTRAQTIGSAGGIVALILALPLIRQYAEWGGAWALVIIQLGTMLALGLYSRAKMKSC